MKLSVRLWFDWNSFWPALQIFKESGTHPDPSINQCFLNLEAKTRKKDQGFLKWSRTFLEQKIHDLLIDTFLAQDHDILTEADLPQIAQDITNWVRGITTKNRRVCEEFLPLFLFCGGTWHLFDKLSGQGHNQSLWHAMTPIESGRSNMIGPLIYRDALLEERYFYHHYSVSSDIQHLHLKMVEPEPLYSPTFVLSAIELISYWQRLISPSSGIAIKERHTQHGKADPAKGVIPLIVF